MEGQPTGFKQRRGGGDRLVDHFDRVQWVHLPLHLARFHLGNV